MSERFEDGVPPQEKKEYSPEKYLETFSRLFADDEIARQIEELRDTPLTGNIKYDALIGEEIEKDIKVLEDKLLQEEERSKLLDSNITQLQKDIVLLYEASPNTLGKILESRKTEIDELIKALDEADPASNSESYNVRKKEFMGVLEECLRQVARENNWQIEIDKNDKYADERLSWHTYISDGKNTVGLYPSLFRFMGTSALGHDVEELEKQIGPSHLKRFVSLISGTPPKLDRESLVLSIDRGIPDIERVPTEEEAVFLEKVIASYY